MIKEIKSVIKNIFLPFVALDFSKQTAQRVERRLAWVLEQKITYTFVAIPLYTTPARPGHIHAYF